MWKDLTHVSISESLTVCYPPELTRLSNISASDSSEEDVCYPHNTISFKTKRFKSENQKQYFKTSGVEIGPREGLEMKLLYPAIFTSFDDGTGYTVEVPDLPGCVTEGDSLLEAIDMAQDAASGWILGELEEGHSYPAASNHKKITVPKGSFVNLIVLDIDAYAEKYGNRAVRKNITIPAWLNTYGEKNNVNFSKVLSDALMEKARNQTRLL